MTRIALSERSLLNQVKPSGYITLQCTY